MARATKPIPPTSTEPPPPTPKSFTELFISELQRFRGWQRYLAVFVVFAVIATFFVYRELPQETKDRFFEAIGLKTAAVSPSATEPGLAVSTNRQSTLFRAQALRGLQVYQEVCSSCHALPLKYRDLADIGLSADEIVELSGQYAITDKDRYGRYLTRPATPDDKIVDPLGNPVVASETFGGRYPADLVDTVLAKVPNDASTVENYATAIENSTYVADVLQGYQDVAPDGFGKVPEGLFYNSAINREGDLRFRNLTGMAPPITDGAVDYPDGTLATTKQMASDVNRFLTWAAARKVRE